MHRISLIVTIVVASSLVSCKTNSTSIILKEVESYIQDRPDSALATIKGVDTLSLHTRSNKALYSLLYAMALDKNYIDTSDINVIRPAIDYYELKGGRKNRARAWYYAGRIYYNGKEMPQALLSYTKALNSMDAQDHYFSGLVYAAISDVYNKTYNDEEELLNARLAHHYFELYGDAGHIILSEYKLGQACHNNGLFDEADSLFSCVIAQADSVTNLAFFAMTDLVTNDIQRGDPQIERDIRLLEYVVEHGGYLSLASYYEYVYLILQSGQNQAAISLLSELSSYEIQDTDLRANEARCRVLQLIGEEDEALALSGKLLSSQNSVVKEQLAQSVFKAQSEYYRLSSDIASQKSIIANLRSIIIISISLILMGLFYFVFKSRKQKLIRERERLILAVEESERLLLLVRNESAMEREVYKKDIDALKSDYEREQGKSQEIRQLYVSLFQKRFYEIGKYYDASFAHRSDAITEKIRQEVLESLQSLLKEISDKSTGQKQFEARINADFEDIIAKIRSDFGNFNNNDIRFICYMVVGFDNPTISFLMDMSKENVRVKKHRIRQKLNEYVGPNAKLYKLIV